MIFGEIFFSDKARQWHYGSQLFVCQILGVLVQKLSLLELEKFSQNSHLATASTKWHKIKKPQIWQINS